MNRLALSLLLCGFLMTPGSTSSLQPTPTNHISRHHPPPPPPNKKSSRRSSPTETYLQPPNRQSSHRTTKTNQRLPWLVRQIRGGASRLKASIAPLNRQEKWTPQVQQRSRAASNTNHPSIIITPPLSEVQLLEIKQQSAAVSGWFRRLSVATRQMLPEITAEAFGTFILLQLALGVGMPAKFVPGALEGIFPIAILNGLAITAACAAVSSKCAAHFNPAITLSMCLFRNFGWSKFIPYVGAQLIGAALAALVNLGLYGHQMANFEAANGIIRSTIDGLQTAKTLACYSSLPPLATFLAESFGVFALTAVVFAVTSDKNTEAKGLYVPSIVGSTVALLITILGPLTGASFNPARELGPRFILSLFGWSPSVAFRHVGVYAAAAFLGATAGGFFVDKFLYADDPNEDQTRHQMTVGTYPSSFQ